MPPSPPYSSPSIRTPPPPRLWHQLTDALLSFVKDPASSRGTNLVELYTSFVESFEAKIDQMALVQIVVEAAKQLYPSRPFVAEGVCGDSARLQPSRRPTPPRPSPPEIDRATALLTGLLAKRARLGPSAALVCEMSCVSLRLKKASSEGVSPPLPPADLAELLDACKRELAAGKKALDALPEGEDPVVHAAYYEAAAAYHRVRGPAQSFFEAAMLFLGYAPADALTPAVRAAAGGRGWAAPRLRPPPPHTHRLRRCSQARQSLAVDVALAALVGEGVYNFGEGAPRRGARGRRCAGFTPPAPPSPPPMAVCAHPILASLAGSPHAWLGALLRAYQVGSIDVFNAVVAEHRAAFEAQPALAANVPVLREKAALLAFMELAAAKPGTDRALPIAEVSRVTRLPADQVEWLVMRALSLGLVRGAIDGVAGVVHVTYVRPRVLDDAQVVAVRERIEDWRAKAHKMLVQIEDNTSELFK